MARALTLSLLTTLLALAACNKPATDYDPSKDLGLMWVDHAAEYHAITRQVYRAAEMALPGFIEDTSWTALPGVVADPNLPPAVILDVDETVVSNVGFQLTFERPFANHKLDTWSSNAEAVEVQGVTDFVAAARAAGATVFFVTNRPCEAIAGNPHACPQELTTIDDIREVGIDVDAEFVMLSGEQPGWDREKLTRREHIAGNYRVVMLIGDDYGDFVPCARKKVVAPCTEPATRAARHEALDTYDDYWGNGWYILPNPMHGSWTSVR